MNHGFLIGRGGSAINKMKEQLGVRFSFASPKDADPELITIIGRKEDVEKAKKELEAKIAGLVSLRAFKSKGFAVLTISCVISYV